MELGVAFSLFFVGLSYGATACMAGCLPFLAPALAVSGEGNRSQLGTVALFSLGRIGSYLAVSLAAFLSAGTVKAFLSDGNGMKVAGGFALGIGLYVLYRSFRPAPEQCLMKTSAGTWVRKLGPLGMGAGVSLSLCPPVLTLAGVAANAGSAAGALGYGLFFGLGAVAVSFLAFGFFLGPVVREIGENLRAARPWLERLAGGLLVLVGMGAWNGWISS